MLHTHINTQRLTVSMPFFVYQRLQAKIPKGQVSQFVTKSIQNQLAKKIYSAGDAVEEFFKLAAKMPKKTATEIKTAINQGRQ